MSDRVLPESREARRRAILESAVRVFAEHGFFAARIRDIAAGAGVAEGTIYLYFDGKDDLLLTAFRDKVEEFCASAREALERVLQEFPGSILFVSHDRYFVDALADKLWIVEGGAVIEFEGAYSAYATELAAESKRKRAMTVMA